MHQTTSSTPITRSLRRLALWAAWLGFGLTAVSAQTTSTGSVTGHAVTAASKSAVSGARVSVSGTAIEAFTDQQGDYRLNGVPAGAVTVNFTFVGYPALALSATVTGGQSTHLDATFLDSDVVTMSAFKISGDVIGTAKAVNSQRAASTLTNIVASDLVGQLPDKNLAESLSRVPGVELARDKGEGRYVVIRGLDPVYNSVSINGVRVSTAEKGSREAALDVISSTFISTLEVSKVTTPDMDGDALGGSVNIKTRTGFDQEGLQEMLQVGSNYGHQEDRHGGYNVASNFADQFDGGKLGISIDLAAEARPFTAYTEPATGWTNVTPTAPTATWVPTSMDFRHYDAKRWRQGVSASIDYKFSDTEAMYVRFLDSSYTEKNQQWLTTFPFASGIVAGTATDTSGTATIKAGGIIKSEAQIVNNKRMSSMVTGLNSNLGQLTNNFELGWTTGKYTRPTLTIAYANAAATTVSYAFDTPYNPTVTQTAGPSLDSPSSYAFSTKSGYSNTTFNMHEVSAQDNVRYDLPDAPNPTYIKVGMEYRSKNVNLSNSKYNIGATVPFANLAAIAYPGNDIQDTMGYAPTFQIRQEAVQSYYSNQSAYSLSPVAATIYGGSFTSLENIAAPYLMGGMTLGHLKLTVGGRLEATDFDITGWSQNTKTGIISPTSSGKNYANFLPSVIGEYEVTPNDIIRASWTNTIARPDYSATAPGRTVDDVNLLVSEGNPKIDPLQSMNYDVSFEHYYSPVGLVSASFFYKSIKNFSYQAGGGTDPQFPGYNVTTFFNGPSAWINGVELNWVQQLSFLPGFLRGLGFEANAIVGDSEAKYPTRPGERLPFTGYGHNSGNLALTYNYAGITARIADQFHGRRLESRSVIGGDATQDQYEEPFHEIDASVSYTYRQHWQIYLEGSNLFNSPLLEYYGGTGDLHRIQTKEAYGWSAESGIRWNY